MKEGKTFKNFISSTSEEAASLAASASWMVLAAYTAGFTESNPDWCSFPLWLTYASCLSNESYPRGTGKNACAKCRHRYMMESFPHHEAGVTRKKHGVMLIGDWTCRTVEGITPATWCTYREGKPVSRCIMFRFEEDCVHHLVVTPSMSSGLSPRPGFNSRVGRAACIEEKVVAHLNLGETWSPGRAKRMILAREFPRSRAPFTELKDSNEPKMRIKLKSDITTIWFDVEVEKICKENGGTGRPLWSDSSPHAHIKCVFTWTVWIFVK